VIVDASVIIDAVVDGHARGQAARAALVAIPAGEPLIAPGHLAIEVMSGLVAAANRPLHPFQPSMIGEALRRAAALAVSIEATQWSDVARARELAQASMRYSDAVYVATAERHTTTLLTADARLARSGAKINCTIQTIDIHG
jgi:predicted nucleic acid-binding protein